MRDDEEAWGGAADKNGSSKWVIRVLLCYPLRKCVVFGFECLIRLFKCIVFGLA